MTMFEKYQKGLLPQTIYSRVEFAETPEEKLFVAGYFTARAIEKGEIQTSDCDEEQKKALSNFG